MLIPILGLDLHDRVGDGMADTVGDFSGDVDDVSDFLTKLRIVMDDMLLLTG